MSKNAHGGEYGVVMHTKELTLTIMKNIKKQLTSGLGRPSKAKPILIWGAPGIGKSAILHSAADMFRNSNKYDYNLHV
jgi:chromosomal replication initiation ATPase DnaA